MTAPFPPDGVKLLSIGELTRGIKLLLEEAFTPVYVQGEISNLARPNSGHMYLTLKDDTAPIRAVLYRGLALRLKFDIHDGLKVVVRGRLTVYEPRGEYQLTIEELQPQGVGPLELAFRQLKERLSVLGYFEKARKRKLPRMPRRVVLVTSPTGSAVRDMLEVLGRRWPAVEVWICPVRVQGEGAAAEIAAAIKLLNKMSPPGAAADVRIDALIVARGGGSLEDLWCFNEEVVAQAIFLSRLIVVSGVGHEDDLTIADLVADVRALTPTEAAERVVPDRTEVLTWLGNLQDRLKQRLVQQIEQARERLGDLAGRRCFRLPLDRIREEERRLDDWQDRLGRAARQRLVQVRERLSSLTARLEALSPLQVLGRGYSLTRREADGVVVRRTDDVRAGERVLIEIQEGRLVARVEETLAATPLITQEIRP